MRVDAEVSRRGVGRPSKAQPYRSFVAELLLANPNLKALEVVARAREVGYTGGKSALYQVIASIRPKRGRPLGTSDRIPGEIVRHGFGQIDVRVGDRTRPVGFVLSRLEYSQWATVSVVADLGMETVFRAMVQHYQRIGGLPFLAIFDRAKPFVVRTDRDGQAPEWDPAFAHAAIQLGLGVEVRARRGADRGPGLNLGNWAKAGLLNGRVFRDEADVEEGMKVWLDKMNDLSTPELGGKTPALLLTEERQRLRALRLSPEDLALRFPVVVTARSTVVFEGESYPMPPDAIGLVGALYLYPARVVIVAGRYEAAHLRRRRADPAARNSEKVHDPRSEQQPSQPSDVSASHSASHP
jgi:hypothetical protein